MHGGSMFSLVTALVSPHAIEALRSKKETLVTTLTENANVLCFQPNDGICLLQGEWENVKKAYAILEEFYFRAQAEIMVREMLKGNVPQMSAAIRNPKEDLSVEWSNSLLSSLFPLVDQQTGSPQVGSATKGNEMHGPMNREKLRMRCGGSHGDGLSSELLRREDGCSKSSDVDTTTLGDGRIANQSEDRVDEDEDEEDEDPPVLSKEGPCRTDVVSLSSEMSDPKEMDFYDTSSSLVECHSAVSNYSRVLNGSENTKEAPADHRNWSKRSNDDELEGGPPQLTDNRSFERNENIERKDSHQMSSPISPFEPQITSPSQLATSSLVVSQQLLNSANAFRTQEFLGDRMSTGCNKLPQFSSLLLGGATLPQGISAWQYADLYSMHLSALQSMHIKQEPASVISSSDVAPAPAPNLCDDDFKNDLGYRFDDDAQLQEMRCTRCSKTYRSEARMKEHVRTHDKDYVPVLHSCPKCSKSFTYRHNMVVHLRRFHYGWQPAKRHVCRICGIRFQKPYLLRLHEHKTHVMQA